MDTPLEKLASAALKLTASERAACAQLLLESLDADESLDVAWLAESIRDSVLSIQLASPEQALPEQSDWDFEPLRHSTRFSWPEDP